MDTEKRNRLCDLLRQLSLMEGDFTLASGKQSSFYIDGKRVTFHPEGLLLTVEAFMQAVGDLAYDAVGGPEMGAVPIAAAMAMRSAQVGRPVTAFFVRKAPKGHGTQKWIEGNLAPGGRALICEDVITSGGSVLKAIERVLEHGCKIAGIVALVDREAGAVEQFAGMGYPYRPVFTLAEVTANVNTGR